MAGDRAGASAGVDAGLVYGPFDLAGAVGVVGEQVYVDVEGDEEGLILGLEDFLEEAGSGLLLQGEDVGLGAGGVEQDADGEGEIFFLGEVLDRLRRFVFGDSAVVFVEVGDVAVLVAGAEVDVDEVGGDFQGGSVDAFVGLGSGCGAGGGRAGRGGGLLSQEAGCDGEEGGQGAGAERRGRRKAHTALDVRGGVWVSGKRGERGQT